MAIPKSLKRGLLTLSFGNLSARILALLSTPLISRIYDPASFGQLSLLTSITIIAAPLFSLRLPLAIPLPRKDSEAKQIVAISLALLALLIILSTAALAIGFQTKIFEIIHLEKNLLLFLPFALLGYGMQDILSNWATRKTRYNLIFTAQLFQSISSTIVKIVYGIALNSSASIGLFYGYICGFASYAAVIMLAERKDFNRPNQIKKKRFCFILNKYLDFIKFLTPSHLLVSLSTQLPIILVYSQFGKDTAGYLGMAVMLINLPVQILARSAGTVLFSEVSKFTRENKTDPFPIIAKISLVLISTSSCVAITLFLFSPEIFSFLLGEKWQRAGEFSSLLAIYFPLQMTQAAISQLFTVYRANKTQMLLNVVRIFSVISTFGYSKVANLGEFETILLLSTVSFFVYASNILAFFSIARKKAPSMK